MVLGRVTWSNYIINLQGDVMLLHRHRVIIWYVFGVAWLNSRGGGGRWGCSKEHDLCWIVDLLNFCTGAYPWRSLKAQCLLQIEVVLYLAGCHVVAQTQGYHLICIWGSEGKFQGRGVVLNFGVLPHWNAVSLCCLHASNDPLCC